MVAQAGVRSRERTFGVRVVRGLARTGGQEWLTFVNMIVNILPARMVDVINMIVNIFRPCRSKRCVG